MRRLWANERRAFTTCVVLGMALAMPSLITPFAVDDFFHIASLEGQAPAPVGWWELYTFAPADPVRRKMLFEVGALPWWSAPDLTLAFFRPLSSALIALDHRLFGRNPLGWHVDSLLWWLASLLVAGRLYRWLLPPALSSLALLLFAVDDSHWLPIAWSAARNGLVATLPALLGLAAHLRWRERTWRFGALVAPLLFAVGLAGGEAALAALAYVAAFELVGRPQDRWPKRLLALSPYVALLGVYSPLRSTLGASITGSALYVDPVRAPLAFAKAAVGRVPALIANSVLGIPSDLWDAVPWTRPWLAALGLASFAGMALWLRSALRATDPRTARPVRWLALGSLLALIPSAAGMLGERLLLPSSFGAAGAFALLLRDGLGRWRSSAGGPILRRLAMAAAVAAIALPNLFLAGPLLVGKPFLWKIMADNMRAEVCRPPLAETDHVVVAWSADPPAAVLGQAIRWFHGRGKTATWTALSLAPSPQRLARTSPHELSLRSLGEPLLGSEWEVLFRSPDHPMRTGDTVTLGNGLRIMIAAVDKGRPVELRLSFPYRIEDSQFRLLVWQDGHLVPLSLPPLGGDLALGPDAGRPDARLPGPQRARDQSPPEPSLPAERQ